MNRADVLSKNNNKLLINKTLIGKTLINKTLIMKNMISTASLLIVLVLLVTSVTPATAYAENETTDNSASEITETENLESESLQEETGEPQTSEGTEGETTDATEQTEPSEGTDTEDSEPAENAEPEEAEEPEPTVPQITVAIKGAGLRVKWKKLKGAKSYVVYRSYKKSSGWTRLKKGITGRSYTDKQVASGKKAYYKVRALMSDGSYTKCSKVVSGIIYRVYVETGHGIDIEGKWDPGCSWNGYQEAKLMIPICKSVTRYLRAKGIYVYTDAYSNNNRNRDWSIKFVKKHNVSVLLNVHCDYQYAPKGTLPLYRYSDQKKLAKCLNKGVHKYVNIKDRGLQKRCDLYTLNKTKGYCVSCLYETGNIKKDNKILRTKYNAIGKGLAKGVCDYLGVEW